MEHIPVVLVIIPARGGSKGIPRKNLRILNGKPLIWYSINTALHSAYRPDVYVSSEDEEILTMARKFGAQIHTRPAGLSGDKTTLDPVIIDAYHAISASTGKNYDLVITLQPTSPLLMIRSLDSAIDKILTKPDIDTILSATDDTHLTWRLEDNEFIPNFARRLNRQELAPLYRETGGFLICRSKVLTSGTRIGKVVDLHLLSGAENIDIDSLSDWNLCEYYLNTKTILFVVSGYPEIGLGHVYNTLALADEITDHEVAFLTDNKSDLAYEKIARSNYKVYRQKHDKIIQDIKEIKPHVVINDILDTTESYIKALKKNKICVINFEDIGSGARYADLVINAMYPEMGKLPGHFYGHKYFLLKNEFMYSNPRSTPGKEVRNVLITYGGVDPNNYTFKTLSAIYGYCSSHNISINVAAGLGYKMYDSISNFQNIVIHRDSGNLSDLMVNADLVFTSAGRTTFEAASVGTPAIVMSQNAREATHFFATSKHGFINLGLGYQLNESFILQEFTEICNNHSLRINMHEMLLKNDIRSGKKRIMDLISGAIRYYYG
ncbi:MAG: acylneuraminate cytidylyltransferase [Bacteroidia bacterium]|nr:acylneuraminate cytidylyltransferase [Bacteroidia bacterium]